MTKEASAISCIRPIAVDRRASRVESLYREHYALVYRLALRYGGGSGSWAEDVTQEVFLRLFETLSRLEEREGFDAWLYRVTTNICLNRLRAQRIRESTPWRWVVGRKARGDTDPESMTAVREELAQAWSLLQQLPPKERVAFSMRYIDGKQQGEIADILGHSKGYVCKLIKRAQARVKAAGWEVDLG